MTAEERSDPDALVLSLPEGTYRYHWQALHMANDIFEATQVLILNPRHVDTSSLELADHEWLDDLFRYRRSLQWRRDFKRRPGLLK